MVEFQTRGLAADDAWGVRPTRPAGLYGELPPLPAQFPVTSALTRKTWRKISPSD